MAKLETKDEEKGFFLYPYRYEGFNSLVEPNQRSWVLTHLKYKTARESFEISGSFLELGDLIKLIEAIENLIARGIEEFNLNPVEPNFRLLLKRIDKNNRAYLLRSSYVKEFSYDDNGETIPVKGSYEQIEMEVDEETLNKFKEELKAEIKSIKYPAKLS